MSCWITYLKFTFVILILVQLKDKTQLGDDVENLKGELNKIREQIHVPESTHVVKGPESVDKTAVRGSQLILITNLYFFNTTTQIFYIWQVYRLIEERNSLLNTGIYTKDDKLVQELNNKINLLSASWMKKEKKKLREWFYTGLF